VESLLRALYPQIEICPLHQDEDPFYIATDEEVSAVELVIGASTRTTDYVAVLEAAWSSRSCRVSHDNIFIKAVLLVQNKPSSGILQAATITIDDTYLIAKIYSSGRKQRNSK
jgi:hypothetical protein